MALRLHFWQAALLGSLLVAAGLGVRSADAQQMRPPRQGCHKRAA